MQSVLDRWGWLKNCAPSGRSKALSSIAKCVLMIVKPMSLLNQKNTWQRIAKKPGRDACNMLISIWSQLPGNCMSTNKININQLNLRETQQNCLDQYLPMQCQKAQCSQTTCWIVAESAGRVSRQKMKKPNIHRVQQHVPPHPV